MGDDEPAEEGADDERGKRQLRLLGLGFVAAGGVAYALANATDPRGLIVLVLVFVGFGALVLERTQGVTPGVSFGLLTGGLAVWAWPLVRTGQVGYDYLGVLMVAIGLFNVLLAPLGIYFRRLGKRLGEGTLGKE
jgi:hypothetical protein